MSRPTAVLLLIGVYIGLAFVLRSYLQYRRTGTTGFRGISGKALSAEWWGGVLLVVAVLGIVAAPLLARADVDRPLFVPTPISDIAGALVLALGLLALLYSQGAMGASWRIGVDASEVTALVTAGPFAIVRNPIFSAMILSVVGLVLLLPTWCALAGLVLMFVGIELQVRYVEEPYLARAHGDAYRSYVRRVGRFVPGVGKTLALMLLVLVGCGDSEVYPVERLQDPATCMECHPKHYQQWSGSMHAYASDDPVFVAMNNRGQRETGGKLGDFCVKCHAPLAVELGYTDGTNFDPAQLPPHVRGITCYFCHNIASVTSTHNNGLVLANDQTMRGGLRSPADNPAHRSKYDPMMDSDINESEICGSCHDIVVPASINGRADVALERTFAEWQSTFFAKDKTPALHLTCGACHMLSSSDVIADAPGLDVTLRTNGFHEHMWPAIDQALTPFPELEAQAAAIRRDLDPSIGIKGPTPLAGGPAPGGICVTPENGGQITVRVDSFGTGHAWPSGAAQDRRAWLELIAYDATNNVIFQSGVVPDGMDPEAIGDPNLFGFWDRTFKSDDSPAHFFWEVARIDSQLLRPPVTLDKFDPAFDHSTTKVFPIAGRANDVERITTRFRFRALPYALLDDLIASGDLDPSIRARLPTLTVGATVKTWEKATRIPATGCSPQ